ncbi:glycine/betaine ABC transporter [Fructilactobacillus lindneri]|uniref:Glycine betaine carnitine ABC transporter, substrate binding lipoprotein n=2 Tax=Fructilactobacillus lindneri TaxID=53444 RepID=A0A0R2JWV3_9LACO|nr:glycine betaine ABC transporter substrate-binding protein [Fructilactobacillus lindneri]ANZ57823.1 glycine/betaine ABC transporter [Fructilactobacillus lindneri]ANZ59092.1 glycine/betaine ABC transporter [Fructilactobacillus lindneri]KRN78724.1 glycine betaine carnitine ABC transporter, substrate binding lipoprotein precursor [Fructilactobacillus lindneri DSM 20690 = JCM 11027]POG98146.1 glycine/betaine ABC transporter [Fructilactobacillus lindneri]POH01738.1 glycine/betaine ABC transporter
MKNKFTKYIVGILTLGVLAITLSACSVTPQKYSPNKSVGPQVHYTITGIDAGAGIMASTQKVLPAYGLKQENWQLQASSTAAMCSQLQKSIKYKQPIVITAWQPHWMFKKYPIKFLKDPKNVYGKSEKIDTVARKGFAKENPGAYKFFKQFHWNSDMMSDIMYKNFKGENPQKTAREFIKDHPKQVKEWTKGVPDGHGKQVRMTYVTWDDAIASTNVTSQILKDKGYNVTTSAMEAQPAWSSIARGSADVTTSAWLPVTSGPLYKKFKNKVEIVTTNCPGAKVGLAVPKYMKNVNSIEDLRNK